MNAPVTQERYQCQHNDLEIFVYKQHDDRCPICLKDRLVEAERAVHYYRQSPHIAVLWDSVDTCVCGLPWVHDIHSGKQNLIDEANARMTDGGLA